MEDRVSEMEAKIAARAELRRDKARLEREFRNLEVAREVEDELATLRKKMLEEPQA
jgi:phage shock protein A